MSQRFKNDQELIAAFTREFIEVGQNQDTVLLGVSHAEAYSLIVALQVLARDPEVGRNQGFLTARRVCENLALQFEKYPALTEILRRGWQREYDE